MFRWVLLGASLILAAGAGILAATVFGASAQAPTVTTTVNIPTGETGPQGPPGPAGSPGAESCPTGSTFTAVVINHPGGQITLYACVKD